MCLQSPLPKMRFAIATVVPAGNVRSRVCAPRARKARPSGSGCSARARAAARAFRSETHMPRRLRLRLRRQGGQDTFFQKKINVDLMLLRAASPTPPGSGRLRRSRRRAALLVIVLATGALLFGVASVHRGQFVPFAEGKARREQFAIVRHSNALASTEFEHKVRLYNLTGEERRKRQGPQGMYAAGRCASRRLCLIGAA